MKRMTLDELKKAELEILIDVADFCQKNGIRYYLGGGTLLGAVRHKGFIPWDDDIDINMPRPDYLKFISTYNGSSKRYYVQSAENEKHYWRTFAKVFDSRTFLQEDAIRIDKPGNAVFIDVFPIDGLPSAKWKQYILFKEQEFFNFLYHGSAWNYKKSHRYDDSQAFFAGLRGIVRTMMKFVAITVLYPLPTLRIVRFLNRNASRCEFEKATYVGAIVDCAHGGSCEKIAKECYLPQREFEFEGHMFLGPVAYDEYLSNLYGDYMRLPPPERRVTHHDYIAYWKE